MLLVEASGQSEVGEFDVATNIQKYIVRFDVPGMMLAYWKRPKGFQKHGGSVLKMHGQGWSWGTFFHAESIPDEHIPMNEAMLVYSFDSENDFCNIKSCYGNGEDLVLDKHSHEVSSW